MIVDDEPPAREGIRLRLEPEPDVEIVGEYGSATEAMSAIAIEKPDLLFLDVQMPGVDGIEMLRRIGPELVPAVILVTAYEKYALDAFEVNVVDYILKPIQEDRVQVALDRARIRLSRLKAVEVSGHLRELVADLDAAANQEFRAPAEATDHRLAYLSRFLVSTESGEVPVSVSAVDWIEAAGDYVRLHEGKTYHLVRTSMSHLEQTLDPCLFGRIHRGTIVRFDRVREIVQIHHGDAEVHLKDDTVLRLSRGYRDRFREALERTPSQLT